MNQLRFWGRHVLGGMVVAMVALLQLGCLTDGANRIAQDEIDQSNRLARDRDSVVELANEFGVDVAADDSIAQIVSNIKVRLIDVECIPPLPPSDLAVRSADGVVSEADAARFRAGQKFLTEIKGRRVFAVPRKK